jgi:hypothetical protein
MNRGDRRGPGAPLPFVSQRTESGRLAQSRLRVPLHPRARRMVRLLAHARPASPPPRPPADRGARTSHLQLRGAAAPGRAAARKLAHEGHRRRPAALAQWSFEGGRRARAQGLRRASSLRVRRARDGSRDHPQRPQRLPQGAELASAQRPRREMSRTAMSTVSSPIRRCAIRRASASSTSGLGSLMP